MDSNTIRTIDELLKDKDNNICFDCSKPFPEWVSVNNAIFLCLDCAGVHRSLGLQVSVVRSLTMDELYEFYG